MEQGTHEGAPGGAHGGKLDGLAYTYVLGGIPAIVAFIVILFSLVHLFGIPA